MHNNSTVDEILKNKQLQEQKEKEEIENLKIAAKEIFKDKNGFYFLKFLKKICLWDEQDNNINNEILIYKKGRRDIWLVIRNLLKPDLLAQVEIFSDISDENTKGEING